MEKCPHCNHPFPQELPEAICPRCLAHNFLGKGDANWITPVKRAEPNYPRIDRYLLLERLGEGGFGEVFLARQSEPIKREVALKVIKPGMDTREVIARFEAERQALALMDHPGIARVLDAGSTEQGLPFFVMDLIPDGVPITQFCQAQRLELDAKLRLFLQVCQAVRHAHERGIIHRDLKPSNILISAIDGHPQARIIDFGIASATAQVLSERTHFTRSHQLLGTPEYMSPEQASNGLNIDARTDVFSLGVLLIELLAGRTPGHMALGELPMDEVVRRLRHRKAIPPSKLTQTPIPQTLDAVCLRATATHRERRYSTVLEFSDDVERFRNCKRTLAYRQRQAKRRWGIGIMAAGCLCLLSLFLFKLRMPISDPVSVQQIGVPEALATHPNYPEEVAKWCRSLRDQPGDSVARERLVRILNEANFPRRSGPPMEHGATVHQLLTLPGEEDSVISASEDGYIRHWKLPAGNIAQAPISLKGSVSKMAIHPQGRWLAAGTTTGRLILWDMQSSHVITLIEGAGSQVYRIAFGTRNGKLYAGLLDGHVIAWDFENQTELWRDHRKQRRKLYDIQPIEDFLAVSGNGGGIDIYEASGGRRLRTLIPNYRVWNLNADDSARALLWAGIAGSIGVIDRATWEVRFTRKPHEKLVYSLEIAPGSKVFATGSFDGRVGIHSMSSGETLQQYRHRNVVYGIKFNEDGTLLASGAKDHTIRLWDVARGSPFSGSLSVAHTLSHFAFFDGGRALMAAGSTEWARQWSLFPDTNESIQLMGPPPSWFIDFVEAYVGKRLSYDGHLEDVSWEEFSELSRKLSEDRGQISSPLRHWALSRAG